MELTGDWAWPLHATLDHPSLVSELGVGSPGASHLGVPSTGDSSQAVGPCP